MRENALLDRFEQERPHLRAVAYRMLGSLSEADDAVQETWLRLDRTDTSEVHNLTGWLTTVVARICLNLLRARESRREDPLELVPEATGEAIVDPEREALLADTVGRALLVVLDTLTPAERLAFVLHDMFAVSFEEIGELTERSPAAARQLASRARRRVRGTDSPLRVDAFRQREVVEAFLAASRNGDFDALLALLDENVVLHADREAGPTAKPVKLSGARSVLMGASAATGRAQVSDLVLIDGAVGLLMAPRGKLALVLAFTVVDDKITEIDVIAARERLNQLQLAIVEN
ncbi:MAG: sigma-70 family RNA polymerase sigma factor [Corynebacteriales bacterium]|nr:sigma-70 family RNA polymerase sigma factor [Mycobacteriales bacterium]